MSLIERLEGGGESPPVVEELPEKNDEPKKTTEFLWDRIREELTGNYVRGYALAIHLGIKDFERNDGVDKHGYVYYDWGGEIGDDGNTSPGEWADYGYIVCTDEEAYEMAASYIRESVWAFNATWLATVTGLDAEIFSKLQENCESSNDAIFALVESTCGMNELVQSAIGEDGLATFIPGCETEEEEVVRIPYTGQEFNIFRTE